MMPVATLLLTGSCLSTAQQEVVPPLRVDSRLVMVGFYAVSHGRVVLNLKPEDVRVFEDGVEQTIAVFEPPSPVRVDRARLPIHISILLDVSGTVVGGGLFDAQLLQRAILAVLKDRVVISLYSFAKECKQLCPPTRELGVLEAALSAAARLKHDGTSLYHSIVQVAQEVQGSRQAAQDVLIVISDGLSDGDHSTAEQAADAASRAGMRIYPVLLRHTARNHSGDEARDLAMQRSHEMRLLEFTGLGRITGGRSFDPDPILNRDTMTAVLTSVAEQLSIEYSLGYYQRNSMRNPKRGIVTVRLRDKSRGKLYGGTRRVVRLAGETPSQ